MATVFTDWFNLQTLFQVLIAIGVVAIVWHLVRPQYAFVIRIRNGAVSVTQGKVRRQFLEDLADIVTKEKVSRGTITARQDKHRIVLAFSNEITPAIQQQIRNTWHAGI